MAGQFLGFAAQSAEQLVEHPLQFGIRVTRAAGLGCLVAAGVCALAGFYLRGEATRSKNEAGAAAAAVQQAWGKVGAQFDNLSPLPNPITGTAPITGPNVLQDLSNLGSDVVSDTEGLGQDLYQGVGDLGTALEDIPPALWAMATALGTTGLTLPSLIWNELVYAAGGSAANILLWVFPYLLIAGAILIAASIVLSLAEWSNRTVISPAWRSSEEKWATRQRVKVERVFDRILRNPAPPGPPAGPAAGPKPEGGEEALSGARSSPEVAPATPPPEAPPPPALPAPPTNPAPEAPVAVPTPPDPSGAISEVGPSSDKQEERVETEVLTREELEEVLGQAMTDQRDRARAGRVDPAPSTDEEPETDTDRLFEILDAVPS